LSETTKHFGLLSHRRLKIALVYSAQMKRGRIETPNPRFIDHDLGPLGELAEDREDKIESFVVDHGSFLRLRTEAGSLACVSLFYRRLGEAGKMGQK
jgi:hypothetical protein